MRTCHSRLFSFVCHSRLFSFVNNGSDNITIITKICLFYFPSMDNHNNPSRSGSTVMVLVIVNIVMFTK